MKCTLPLQQYIFLLDVLLSFLFLRYNQVLIIWWKSKRKTTGSLPGYQSIKHSLFILKNFKFRKKAEKNNERKIILSSEFELFRVNNKTTHMEWKSFKEVLCIYVHVYMYSTVHSALSIQNVSEMFEEGPWPQGLGTTSDETFPSLCAVNLVAFIIYSTRMCL